MKILFLDLSMGAAGDMLAAALYELIEDKEGFVREINAAGIPKVKVNPVREVKCGICGTHMDVEVDGRTEYSIDVPENHHAHVHMPEKSEGHEKYGEPAEHKECEKHKECDENAVRPEHSEHIERNKHGEHAHGGHCHRSMAEITAVIDGLKLSGKVKSDIKAVYGIIADAESRAHGMEVGEIHFHEVGSMDAVADIASVCLLMEILSPETVIATPVCTGFGNVRASHGVIPVPAPATSIILEEIPSYEGDIRAELCTPTGAALVKYFALSYGRMPLFTARKTGYGMGMKNFERCNCVRAVMGMDASRENDSVTELAVTIDDMTGEEIGFACERFLAAGALDVYTCPVYMKKQRPGVVISVLVRESDRDRMAREIFRHTTTLGIREYNCRRYILERERISIETDDGSVSKKISRGYGTEKEKLEYEDLAGIARDKEMSLFEVRSKLAES